MSEVGCFAAVSIALVDSVHQVNIHAKRLNYTQSLSFDHRKITIVSAKLTNGLVINVLVHFLSVLLIAENFSQGISFLILLNL